MTEEQKPVKTVTVHYRDENNHTASVDVEFAATYDAQLFVDGVHPIEVKPGLFVPRYAVHHYELK